MSERYGVYEGEADSQYVGCVTCEESIDLFEPHPMFRDDAVSEFGDLIARTYHFCSDDCLEAWKREEGYLN
ncbi:DUF7576 family protein [Halorussus amylolyticus]|uniref:DUF7576 family protein n=1 Tax=Halorussus amylolyticus TaxID=1126242 RepID=UPI00104DF6DA|nr:hypothetical protein [Halorussus amylolyticus]